jgi:hypothetical protein
VRVARVGEGTTALNRLSATDKLCALGPRRGAESAAKAAMDAAKKRREVDLRPATTGATSFAAPGNGPGISQKFA